MDAYILMHGKRHSDLYSYHWHNELAGVFSTLKNAQDALDFVVSKSNAEVVDDQYKFRRLPRTPSGSDNHFMTEDGQETLTIISIEIDKRYVI